MESLPLSPFSLLQALQPRLLRSPSCIYVCVTRLNRGEPVTRLLASLASLLFACSFEKKKKGLWVPVGTTPHLSFLFFLLRKYTLYLTTTDRPLSTPSVPSSASS